MKVGLGTRGYTIVEALIFMAVTSAFFVLVAVVISGQQAKTEFNQSTRDFESRLLDIANDISTGYFNVSDTVSCATSLPMGGGEVNLGVAGSAQEKGTRQDCIVVGQLVRFTADGEDYLTAPVVGKRLTNATGFSREVTSLSESRPVAVVPGTNPPYSLIPNASESARFGGGLVFKSARFETGASTAGTRAVLFATTFKGYTGTANDLESGTIQADVYPLPSTTFPMGSVADIGDSIRTFTGWDSLVKNPASGVILCFQPGASASRSAEITIGGSGRALSTKTDYKNTACPVALP